MAPKRKPQPDQKASQPPKRSKRLKPTPPSPKKQQKEEEQIATTSSVLGGLKDPTLHSRVSGPESPIASYTTFSVPYKDDKHIVCERHESSSTTGTKPHLIFTHGAGGGLANPATRLFAEGFGTVAPAVCMQGTMNLKSRVSTFLTVLTHERERHAEGQKQKQKQQQVRMLLGGRSMGARAAVIAVTEEYDDAGGQGEPMAVVLASYPLVSVRKDGSEDVRDQILYDLPAETDVLFVAGSEDKMCPIPQLERVIKGMEGKNVWLLEVEGADHSMSLKNKKAVEPVRRKSGELAAGWAVAKGVLESRHVVLRWDGSNEECVVQDVGKAG